MGGKQRVMLQNLERFPVLPWPLVVPGPQRTAVCGSVYQKTSRLALPQGIRASKNEVPRKDVRRALCQQCGWQEDCSLLPTILPLDGRKRVHAVRGRQSLPPAPPLKRTRPAEIEAARSVPREAAPGQTLLEATAAGECHGTLSFPFFGSRVAPGIFKMQGRLSSGTEPPPQAPDPTRHLELSAQAAIRIGGQTTPLNL
ncbi:hypothetical protein NDU88_008562 [Pleurodeles waltl]|uniref:Uncharacterized protein n=1 Tax=Pleurodeles waltl TaxID=8319 RepID=A0AAV7NZP5_PLEWA|nr:hypothetical protein NDU88_008562 [Pleurodeles waltl]